MARSVGTWLGRVLIVAVLASCLVTWSAHATDSDEECELARKNLQLKKQQLTDYVDALQKASEDSNLQILELLNIKINELIEQNRQLAKKVSECDANFSASSPGLPSSKSEENKYATKNCDELKRLLVPLIRKIHTLQRREKSLFSEFSASERADLDNAFEELKLIQNALKGRCATPKKTGPAKKRPNM